MRILFSIALLFSLLPAARGNNLSSVSCPDATLAYYESNFASPVVGSPVGPCASGILNFSNFASTISGVPLSGLLSASEINLSPDGPPPGDTGDTGFSLSGISVGAGQTATYVLDWFFAIDAGPSASGADLGMDPPFGNVTITQEYCVDSYLSAYAPGPAPSCIDQLGLTPPPVQSLTVTTSSPNASIVFSPDAYYFGDVRTIIQLTGGTAGAGFDSVTDTTAIVSRTPEPDTILLIPGCLLMLCGLRKRALKQ